ncbi:hypothetical protein [Streptomyces sp. NPDC004976]
MSPLDVVTSSTGQRSRDPDFPLPVLTVNPEANPPARSATGSSPSAATDGAETAPAPSVAATPTPSAAAEEAGSSLGIVVGIGAEAAGGGAGGAVLLQRRRSRNVSP